MTGNPCAKGPPENGGRAHPDPAASVEGPPHHTDSPKFNGVAALHARRAAARRMVPLDCGCRDPWLCRCTQSPLSDCARDGWRDAAQHVRGTGQTPLVPIEVRRALWRRGGPDRELAEWLTTRVEGRRHDRRRH
jgi:hypothetical protein